MTQRFIHISFRFVIFSCLLMCLFYLTLRVLSPYLYRYNNELESILSTRLNRPVQVHGVAVKWRDLIPYIHLSDVHIIASNQEDNINLSKVITRIDILQTIRQFRISFGSIQLVGVKLEVQRNANGAIAIKGLKKGISIQNSSAFETWLLSQKAIIIAGDIVWIDMMTDLPPLNLQDVRILVSNKNQQHRFIVSTILPKNIGHLFSMEVQFRGNPFTEKWSAEMSYRLLQMNLSHPMITHFHWHNMQIINGKLDLVGKSSWKNGKMKTLTGQLTVNQFSLDSIDATYLETVDFKQITSNIVWSKNTTGGDIEINNLFVNRKDWHWKNNKIKLKYLDNEKISEGSIYAEKTDLAAIKTLLLEISELPIQYKKLLTGFDFSGEVKRLYIRFSDIGWNIRAQLNHVNVNAWQDFPGLKSLSGVLQLSENEGTFLISKCREINGKYFRFPVPIHTIEGQIVWRKIDEIWHISNQIKWSNRDIHNFSLTNKIQWTQGKVDILSTTAQLKNIPIKQIYRYLPTKLLKKSLVTWLDWGLRGGQINNLKVNYRTSHRKKLDLDVRFDVEKGYLQYHRAYPELKNFNGKFFVRGKKLTAEIFNGEIQHYRVSNINVTLPKLGHSKAFFIDGNILGDINHAVSFLRSGVLPEKITQFFQSVDGTGEHLVHLDLTIPLVKSEKLITQGYIRFYDNDITLFDTPLTEVSGRLKLSPSGLTSNSILASYLSDPIRINFIAEEEKKTVKIRAESNIENILKYYKIPLNDYLSGKINWSLDIDYHAKQEEEIQYHFTSDLSALTSTLPWPLSKQDKLELALTLQIGKTADQLSHIAFTLGDRINALIDIHKDTLCGQIHFGTTSVACRDNLLKFTGALKAFSLRQWQPIYQSIFQDIKPQKRYHPVFDLAIDKLDLGILLHNVLLRAEIIDLDWIISIIATETNTKVKFPEKIKSEPIVIDMQYLNYIRQEDTDLSAIKIDDIPAIDLNIKRLQLNHSELENISLSTRLIQHGLGIAIKIEDPFLNLTAKGKWLNTPITHFDIALNARKLNQIIDFIGKGAKIVDGKLAFSAHVNWPGSPFEKEKHLNGDCHIISGNGRIVNVDPGIGRILGILDITEIPNRINFGIDDLIRKGLVISGISGDFLFTHGIAESKNIHLKGPTAEIYASGNIDLVDNKLHQYVTVIPNVTSGLPMAGAIAGGPATGATLLVLQKLIGRSLNKLGKLNYLITGSWDKLQVQSIEN